PGFPVTVGAGGSVGHRAVLHGCTIEHDALIGMGAVVLNGARVGAGSLLAAGAVVTEGMQIPPGWLVAGAPAQVRGERAEEDIEGLGENALTYVELAAKHREAAAWPVGPAGAIDTLGPVGPIDALGPGDALAAGRAIPPGRAVRILRG